MFVINHRNIFFAISGILVLASIVAIAFFGLRPSVDFTGGSIIEVRFEGTTPDTATVATALAEAGFENSLVRETDDGGLSIRTRALTEGDRGTLVGALTTLAGTTTVDRLSSVGPTVGEELRRKTMIAVVLVVLMIILYIAYTFRKVAKPISSWMYGVVAIVTLLHDVVIPAGVFAVLGRFAGFEADTLFVVALLTILGISVNDTIVIFDRIRENLAREGDAAAHHSFAEIVGKSLEQSYTRSFNTSFTIILVLLILFFLGGPTIHTFMLTLLVGQVAGTYSSIFLASPLLVVIANRKLKATKK